MSNPLLSQAQLPPFATVMPTHVVPALTAVLAENRAKIAEILALPEAEHTWDTLLAPLQALDNKLSNVWSIISHLNAVRDTTAFREQYEQALTLLSDYTAEMAQHSGLCQAITRLAESPTYQTLSLAQRRVIDFELRDFRLAGVDLPAKQKAAFAKAHTALTQCCQQFEANVLDATEGWQYTVTEAQRLAGLPDYAVAAARAKAEQVGVSGWQFGLDQPSYLAVLTYAEDSALREAVYTAYVTRASDQGPQAGRFDNAPVMHEILCLRQRMARWVGFPHFSARSLATKMAASVDEVNDFHQTLFERSYAKAKAEYAELCAFAADELGLATLAPWDISFASERLCQARYAISQAALRPYFPVNHVLAGLFGILQRLFKVRIELISDVDVWHPTVQVFALYDAAAKTPTGYFYVDLFARTGKRGGAWMDECRSRFVQPSGEVQLPVAYINCNFTAPIAEQPPTLTHDEVTTLFHEFGHGLHHVLTDISYPSISGINGVAWDAVECPSQWLEQWCWQPEALALLSCHVETQAPLPSDMVNQLLRSRTFQAGLRMVRQLQFSRFDFELHTLDPEGQPEVVRQAVAAVRDTCSVLPVDPCNRFENSFTHIFAGGYAAGYYSYQWAEVLASDAFALFEETDIFSAETGHAFRQTILARGGSEDMAVLFARFRGRAPNIDAFLRHRGIDAANTLAGD